MKYLIISCCLTLLMAAGCKKETTLENELAKLPPATQTGANTFGCLLNGKAWVAQNKDCWILCDPFFETYYDNSNGGFVALIAVLKNSLQNIDEEIDIAFDSSNFNKQFSFIKGNNHLNIRILNYKGQTYNSAVDPTVGGSGDFQITHYDLQTGIISGVFEFTVSKTGGETIRITNGRFDSKL